MSNQEMNDRFARSIQAAFTAVGMPMDFQFDLPRQEEPRDAASQFLRDQMNGTHKHNPWGKGWHNGFPPGSQA